MSKTQGVFFGVFLFTEEEVTLIPQFAKTNEEKSRAFRDFESSCIRDTDPVPPIVSDEATVALLLDVCKHATALHAGLDFQMASPGCLRDSAGFGSERQVPVLAGYTLLRPFGDGIVETARAFLTEYSSYERGRPDRGLYFQMRTNASALTIAESIVAAAYGAGLVKASSAAVDAKIEAILQAQTPVLDPLVQAALAGTRAALNNLTKTWISNGFSLDVQSMPSSPATNKARKLIQRLCRIVDALEHAHNKL